MPELEEGAAIDITRRDWAGLPWDADPATCSDRDWQNVLPGTYVISKIDDRWVYIRLGGKMYKLDLGDVRAHWPKL